MIDAEAGQLEQALAEALGARVVSVERAPHAYRTSYALETLEVGLEGGERLRLLFKNLGAASDLTELARPAFVGDPRRELEVYRDVLGGLGLGTPRCYGTVVDPDAGRYWLFVERVEGIELWQVGELEVWEEAARWLARLHAECTDVSHPALIRYDRDYFESWPSRALARRPDSPLRSLVGRYGVVVERLLALPTTFVHGEFYASNVLVEQTVVGGARIRPVDWEMAGIGPGLLDLAALTAGEWSEAERGTIEAAYNDALPVAYAPGAMAEGLECARLHIALQWLGWGPSWSPPDEHARDWLAAALLAAGRLGLLGGETG